MISGISGAGSFQYQSVRETKLTEDQKQQLEEILAKYDPENITEEQTKSLFEELKSSGIRPSKEVKEIIDATGFKPPQRPEGPPPEEMSGMNQNLPDYLMDFLEKQKTGNVTESDLNALIQELQNNGEINQGVLIDKKV